MLILYLLLEKVFLVILHSHWLIMRVRDVRYYISYSHERAFLWVCVWSLPRIHMLSRGCHPPRECLFDRSPVWSLFWVTRMRNPGNRFRAIQLGKVIGMSFCIHLRVWQSSLLQEIQDLGASRLYQMPLTLHHRASDRCTRVHTYFSRCRVLCVIMIPWVLYSGREYPFFLVRDSSRRYDLRCDRSNQAVSSEWVKDISQQSCPWEAREGVMDDSCMLSYRSLREIYVPSRKLLLCMWKYCSHVCELLLLVRLHPFCYVRAVCVSRVRCSGHRASLLRRCHHMMFQRREYT